MDNNDLITSFGALINSNIINEKKDLHDVKINAINTLMQNIVNDKELDYQKKWEEIEKLNALHKRKNLVTIIKDAFSSKENRLPNDIDADWLLDFMDKAQNISNVEFQKIWSAILETEAEQPGKISKKLLQQLYLMNSNDAKNFINFSRFCFADGGYKDMYHPILFLKSEYKKYCSFGIDYKILEELQNLNLIICDYGEGYCFKYRKKFFYKDKFVAVNNHGNIDAGNVKLTSIGQTLINLIHKSNNDVIFKYTIDKWLQDGCIVQVNNKFFPEIY